MHVKPHTYHYELFIFHYNPFIFLFLSFFLYPVFSSPEGGGKAEIERCGVRSTKLREISSLLGGVHQSKHTSFSCTIFGFLIYHVSRIGILRNNIIVLTTHFTILFPHHRIPILLKVLGYGRHGIEPAMGSPQSYNAANIRPLVAVKSYVQ